MGRYDNSSDEGSSRRGRSRSPRRTPPRYSQDPGHSRSHRDGPGYSRSSDRDRAYTYKVLCISSIHPKASEDVVRDELYREYRKFPDVSVKVVIEHDGERVAYVYFRTWEDARDAKHISRGRIMFYDKPAMVEAVYDTAPQEYLPRRRSRSPMMDYPPMDGRYMRPRSPPRDYDRFGPPIPGPMDPYGYDMPHHDPYGYGRGYPYREPPRGPPYGGGFGPPYGPPGYARPRFERHERKERFPNYLHHIPPEDDPTACRTLFAGNMELNITEEELRRIFNRYGNVEDIDIKRPPPGTGNAFAFVRFENLDQSNRCKTELSGQYIGKFQVKIGYGKVLPSCKVWVGGLGSWTTVQILEREFDRFGAIKKIEYVKGEPYAHVLYETLDAAQAAVNEMRGFPLGGPDKRIKTDFAADETTVQFGRRPPFDGPGGGDDFRGRGRGGFRGGRGNFRGGFGDRGDFSEDSYHSTLRQVPTENRSVSPSRRSESGSEEGGHLNTAKTLSDIARKVGTSWHGAMILKSSLFACKFHLTDGDADIAESLLKDENEKPLLRITQRLRLDQPKLDDVQKRISSSPHAIYVALPTSSSPVNVDDTSVQARSLRNLVSYLKQKEAAGVISLLSKEGDTTGVLYAFPPCNFSKELLTRTVPAMSEDAAKEDHLLVVVVRGSSAQLALN